MAARGLTSAASTVASFILPQGDVRLCRASGEARQPRGSGEAEHVLPTHQPACELGFPLTSMSGNGWRSVLGTSLREAGWAPMLVFVVHVVASRGFGAYALLPGLDVPMHLLGGAAITFFLGRLYRVAGRAGLLGQPAGWLYFAVVLALAISTTVLWEFAEFLCDRRFGMHAQLGLEDTLLDMFLGCLGSLVVLVISAVRAFIGSREA